MRITNCILKPIITEKSVARPNEYVFKGISYYTCDMAFVCPNIDLNHLKPDDDVAEALVIHPRDIDYGIISFPSIVNILKSYVGSLG